MEPGNRHGLVVLGLSKVKRCYSKTLVPIRRDRSSLGMMDGPGETKGQESVHVVFAQGKYSLEVSHHGHEISCHRIKERDPVRAVKEECWESVSS